MLDFEFVFFSLSLTNASILRCFFADTRMSHAAKIRRRTATSNELLFDTSRQKPGDLKFEKMVAHGSLKMGVDRFLFSNLLKNMQSYWPSVSHA